MREIDLIIDENESPVVEWKESWQDNTSNGFVVMPMHKGELFILVLMTMVTSWDWKKRL